MCVCADMSAPVCVCLKAKWSKHDAAADLSSRSQRFFRLIILEMFSVIFISVDDNSVIFLSLQTFMLLFLWCIIAVLRPSIKPPPPLLHRCIYACTHTHTVLYLSQIPPSLSLFSLVFCLFSIPSGQLLLIPNTASKQGFVHTATQKWLNNYFTNLAHPTSWFCSSGAQRSWFAV